MILKIVIVILAIMAIAIAGMILKNRAEKAAKSAIGKADQLINDGKQDVKDALNKTGAALRAEDDKL